MMSGTGQYSAFGARDAVGRRLWIVSPLTGEQIWGISEHTGMVYDEIVGIVRRAQRDLGRGVLPRDVVARLPYSRAEGTVRRDMAAMWRMGLLARVGGDGARRGYRVVSVRYDAGAVA